MGTRRVLVIGSQCEALGPAKRLSFLPEAAKDLYVVMTDPELGGCEPALTEGGLYLDPTVDEVKQAISDAFKRASEDEASLFIAYIGHGEVADASGISNDFYLLPHNAGWPPDSDKAVHLVQRIKELHRRHNNVDGFVVLLDACYGGVCAIDAADKWVTELRASKGFELLSAVADRTAADGCFTRNLTEILRGGIETIRGVHVGELVRCENVKELLIERCPFQEPQLPTNNARQELFLARNAAHLRRGPPWLGTSTASEIERLTAWLQPTGQLAQLANALDSHRCVALFGVAGSGKSTLAAALSRPEVIAGKIPAGFIHGIALISERTTSELLAYELAVQLERSVPGFGAATEEFRRRTTAEEFNALDALERRVIGPLRWLEPSGQVRVVIDGLDRLSTGASQAVLRGLVALAADSALSFVHLLVTAQPNTPVPPSALLQTIDRASDEDVGAYFGHRQISTAMHQEIIKRTDGNWLIAQLLADIAADPTFDLTALPSELKDLYGKAPARAGAADIERWRTMLRPILGALAAGGVGPVLPFELLAEASARMGGPSRPTPIHDVLFDLRGFVARSIPRAGGEQAGVFHQTFTDYLFGPSAAAFGIDPQEPHGALAAAIETLAPMTQHKRDDPLHRYAAAREAEHLWGSGDQTRALQSLQARQSVIPSENLKRWQSWLLRAQKDISPDHPDTLRTRYNIATWTGRTGNALEALRLFEVLLPDQLRVHGPDHPDTLRTRNDIAIWTGQAGNAPEALRLSQVLLPDQLRVHGPDHPDTFRTRNNIASWIGETGNAPEALRLFEALLPDRLRVLGPDHPDTPGTRNNIAIWTGRTGNAPEALRLFEALLPDRLRVLGPDHPDTLATRHNIATWTGRTGNAREALRLFEALLPDQVRVLGPDHPDTLRTRYNIAYWTGRTGNAPEALRLFEALLPDRLRVLGPDHPDTLGTRNDIAIWTEQAGNAPEALRLSQVLLPDQLRVLGPDHPDTLRIRHNIAHWTGQAGNAPEVLRLFEALLPDRLRVLGPDHPDTLATRNNIAIWTGETGNAPEALRLFEALLPDRLRALGPDHPDTLATRHNIASWIGETGNAPEALLRFEALLWDRLRVLGPDHPDTLRTRDNIAIWTGETGNAPEALRLFEALLPDQLRVLGPDHPDTLWTRHNIATWTGRTGNVREALRLFEASLPDRLRVLGPDHPDTLRTRHNIAHWTGQLGNAPEALRLFEALLPVSLSLDRANRKPGQLRSDALPDHANFARLMRLCLLVRANLPPGSCESARGRHGCQKADAEAA